MKYLLILMLFTTFSFAQNQEFSISGKVEETTGCSPKAMVWLSLDKENYSDRLLLMHTEVPSGGTFKFYVKAGKYQVRASDEAGCEYVKSLVVSNEYEGLMIKRIKK